MDCQLAAMLGLDLKSGIHNCVPVMVWWPIPYRVATMMSGWLIKMTIVATIQEYKQEILFDDVESLIVFYWIILYDRQQTVVSVFS